MAIPPLPKALRSFGAESPEQTQRRIDQWAKGMQATVAAIRDGHPALLRRLDELEGDVEALAAEVAAGGGGGSFPGYGAHVDLAVGGAGTDGVATTVSRSDHTHGTPKGSPIALVVGGSNVDGASGNFSDASHRHELPAFGTSAGQFAEGNHTHAAISGGYFDRFNPDAPPSTAHADDDECNSGALAGGWTLWDPSGWLSLDATRGYYSITAPNGAGARTAGWRKAIPASEFRITAKIGLEVSLTGVSRVGLYIADNQATNPTTADLRTIGLLDTQVAETCLFTANTGAAGAASQLGAVGGTNYVRLRVNGTSWAADHSSNGISWLMNASTGTTAFTPAHCGFFFHTDAVDPGRGTVHWVRFSSGTGTSGIQGAPLSGAITRYLKA